MQPMQGDWLPARAALHPTGLYFSLREIRPAELQDPFMQETIARLPARESVVQVAREDVGKGTAGTGPAGLIFHVARCGSTLVSQLLKQHVGVVAYAEPLPVNEILLPPHKWPRPELVAALRSLGAAFSAPCAEALRPQADELEHAFLRPGRGSVSGNAVGAVPARSPGSRSVPASAAGRMDLERRRRASRAIREVRRSGSLIELARGIPCADIRRVLRRSLPPRSVEAAGS